MFCVKHKKEHIKAFSFCYVIVPVDDSSWSSHDDYKVGQPFVFQANNYEERIMYCILCCIRTVFSLMMAC